MDFVDDIASILELKAPRVYTIEPSETVFEAIRLMADKRIGALPVVERDTLVGVVSERDYTRKVILRGRSSRDTPVCEIMTFPVITIEPWQTVEEAMRLMTGSDIRHLPVTSDGELVGIVSLGDLARHVIAEQRAALAQLEGYVIGRYPS